MQTRCFQWNRAKWIFQRNCPIAGGSGSGEKRRRGEAEWSAWDGGKWNREPSISYVGGFFSFSLSSFFLPFFSRFLVQLPRETVHKARISMPLMISERRNRARYPPPQTAIIKVIIDTSYVWRKQLSIEMNGAAGRRSASRENLGTSYVNHISVYGAIAPVPSTLLTPRHVNYFVNFPSTQATGHRFQPSRFRSLGGAAEGHPPSANYAATQRFAAAFSSSVRASFHWHWSIVKFGLPDEGSKAAETSRWWGNSVFLSFVGSRSMFEESD